MHDALQTLADTLRELPGIGPRQAKRLAYWLMRRDQPWITQLSKTLLAARAQVRTCDTCMRLFEAETEVSTCRLCRDAQRSSDTLMVVEKDIDLENIERTGTYMGRYFVLGGTTSPLDAHPERRIRIQELLARLRAVDEPVTEVVLALSATADGEDTGAYLKEQLRTHPRASAFTVTELGRGLSTGTELEYVDAATMKNAFEGRH